MKETKKDIDDRETEECMGIKELINRLEVGDSVK